jgi:hypothetical protein
MISAIRPVSIGHSGINYEEVMALPGLDHGDSRSDVGLPLGEIDPVPLHDFQQSIVLDFAECLVGLILDQESEVRKQLAEANTG